MPDEHSQEDLQAIAHGLLAFLVLLFVPFIGGGGMGQLMGGGIFGMTFMLLFWVLVMALIVALVIWLVGQSQRR